MTREQGERRVADPCVAVVPVALPADLLGQPERRGRDERAVVLRDEQLQHERGPVHDLAPAPRVGRPADPLAPEVHRVLERLGDVRRVRGRAAEVAADLLHHERHLVPRGQLEGGACHAVAVDVQRHGGAEAHRGPVGPLRGVHHLAVADLDAALGAPVVEARVEDEVEGHRAADALHAAHQHPGVVVREEPDGHEVRHFGEAVVGEEPGDEHVRVRQVHLAVRDLVLHRLDGEAPAPVTVEQRGEDRRRVAAREAAEVDGAVDADERDRVLVADDAVVLDRLVRVVVGHYRSSLGALASRSLLHRAWM